MPSLTVIPSFAPTVSTIAETIQLSLSPVFMLAGIGALLNVLVGRLSRVVDRARELERVHAESPDEARLRQVWELRILDRRMNIIHAALMFAALSAIMTCLVVALLFVAELVKLRIGRYLAAIFILAMVMLTASLCSFMIEVRLSLRAIRINPTLIARRR